MYLYKTTLFRDTSNVIGAPTSNTADLADFEANFKATATPVNELVVAETTFYIADTYANFKALISAPLTWADIKYIQRLEKYELFLLN